MVMSYGVVAGPPTLTSCACPPNSSSEVCLSAPRRCASHRVLQPWPALCVLQWSLSFSPSFFFSPPPSLSVTTLQCMLDTSQKKSLALVPVLRGGARRLGGVRGGLLSELPVPCTSQVRLHSGHCFCLPVRVFPPVPFCSSALLLLLSVIFGAALAVSALRARHLGSAPSL